MKIDITITVRALLAAAALHAVTAAPAGAADLAPQARPEEPKWFIKLGPGGVLFNSSAKLSTPLGQVPGASARAGDNFTGLFEIGYFFTDNLAVSLTGGIPPTAKLTGTGTAAGLGTIGQAVYGPATLTAHYHYKGLGAFQPYAGLGVGYAFIFDSKDGAVTNLNVKGAPAFVMQGGFDYVLDRNWAVFVDVKKLILSVDATGNLGPTPINARVKLDPTIASTGISYRF
jgi:outer membrane protein